MVSSGNHIVDLHDDFENRDSYYIPIYHHEVWHVKEGYIDTFHFEMDADRAITRMAKECEEPASNYEIRKIEV